MGSLRWRIIKIQIDDLVSFGNRLTGDLDRLQLTVSKGMWPDSHTTKIFNNILNNTTPTSWKDCLKDGESNLRAWITRLEDVINHLCELDIQQELHIIPIARFP